MNTALKWVLGILGAVALLLLLGFGVAALMPVEVDPPVDMGNHGAGSDSVEPAYSGLLREYPPTNEADGQQATTEQIELGRQLFFDPVLSENNDISCATCHHPDLGFGDGLATAAGHDGTPLERNTPSLWNVAYAQNLFWDGRVSSLEEQVLVPLTHPNEMGVSDAATLVAELRDIPAYADAFAAAYGSSDAVTLENVQRALGAFQRSLTTDDSPFDRYAAGDFDALTPQQRRGLAVFRSGATRCFECHTAPTFGSDTFRVVGVPSNDPGRAGVVDDGVAGAFKVPSLRNVALTAPYMHNGSMATLEEVVDFYAAGGGRAHGAEQVDVFVNGFELTEQNRADLLAFLHALTDESSLPEVPTVALSGLPTVSRIDNPAREISAAANAGTTGANVDERDPITHVVRPGERIQAAVDKALPGDTIEIEYGVYHERVAIDVSDITLLGIPNADGDYPILDGENVLSEGVIASGNNFRVGQLHTRNFTTNGILVEGVRGVHFHDLIAENVGTYGVYPVRSTDVLIERVVVSGVDDAGIYAGQSENVVVRESEAFGNVIGIELENTLNGEVYDNYLHGNSNGILIVLLPQLTSKISANTDIYNNRVESNNLDNFAPEGAIARIVPPGTGILVIGSDNNKVHDNIITDNKTAGVAVFSLTGAGMFNENELDVGPLAEGNHIYNNQYSNNGYDPDAIVAELGVPSGDLLWDTTGIDNRFDEQAASSFPPLLPGDNWPAFARNAYGNILGLLAGLLG